jgi:hypothetical protein
MPDVGISSGEASLVKPRERSHPACARPARRIAWLLPDGTLVPVRCGASNRCSYCARLSAIENMVVLQLDARENSAPSAVMTLTTVEVRTSNEQLRKSIEQVTRALRRRSDGLEYCGFVEWTSGQAARSGGKRRVHVHFLLKGLPPQQLAPAEAVVRAVWRARTRAHRVEVRELRAAGGVTAYLALHHEKASQGPPPDWKGKRLRPSRGYFGGPGQIAHRREQARALLLDRRLRRLAERAVAELLDGQEVGAWIDGAPYDELLERELERVMAEQRFNTPLLVRVQMREHADPATGELKVEYGDVLGPVEPPRKVVHDRDARATNLPAAAERPIIPPLPTNAPGDALTPPGLA